MRFIIGLIILGTFRITFGQEVVFDTTPYLPKPETCDKAVLQVDRDSDVNVLKISRGPMFGDEYERFYRNYMVTKFGIEIVGTGCLISDFEECYNDRMHKIIQTKYGQNFFEMTEDKIKKEFEVFRNLEQVKKRSYINFEFTYKVVDQNADFALGREDFIKELHNRVDFSQIDFPGKVIGLYLVIGQDGTIDRCQVISKDFPKADAEKIEKAINEIGRWKPARLYGFDVKSEKIVGIPSRL